MTGNYVANSEAAFSTVNRDLILSGNSFSSRMVGLRLASFPSNTYLSSRPTGTEIFFRPNTYEPGRITIVIFNWAHLASVDVPLASVLALGTRYEIRNSQDFFGPQVLAGTYEGGSLTLPMNGLSVAPPVGGITPPPTGPEFNVFIFSRPTPLDWTRPLLRAAAHPTDPEVHP